MSNISFIVIPEGAGGSFMGYLQQYMNQETLASVDLKANRKKNCWDEYVLSFKKRVPGEKAFSDTVLKLKKDILNDVQWGKDPTTSYKKLQHEVADKDIEIITSEYPIGIEKFIDTEVKFFIDCDKDTFTWCYKLADIKHGRKISEQNNINRLWNYYCKARAEFNPEISFSYRDIFKLADPIICDKFLRSIYTSPKPLYPTFKIDNAISMIKQYNKRNEDMLQDESI